MSDKPSLPPIKSGFSRRFDLALAETLLTDAMAKADGWTLAQFAEAPGWLRQIYARHAESACREMQVMEKTLQPGKPE